LILVADSFELLVKKQLKVVRRMSLRFKLICEELGVQRSDRLDIWTDGKRSRIENKAFRKSVIDFYQIGTATPVCMVTGVANEVVAAHLYKSSTRGRGLIEYGLKRLDYRNPRIGVLLVKSIEEAFDVKKVCFLYDPLQQSLHLKVLDPSLMTVAVYVGGPTFAVVDGMPLRFPVGTTFQGPYRRILCFHAKCAFENAVEEGWIGGSNEYAAYFEFSEGASIPADVEDDEEEEESDDDSDL
jgi:hypothetical protein